MKKNSTYECAVPTTRNELIDMLGEKKAVIVLKNELITKVYDELNKERKKANKKGGLLMKGGLVSMLGGVLLASNPIGWLIGGTVAITAGAIRNLGNTLNEYNTYKGKDKFGRAIWIMIHSDVDFKLDTIIYPDFVKNVDTKRKVKNIKIQ